MIIFKNRYTSLNTLIDFLGTNKHLYEGGYIGLMCLVNTMDIRQPSYIITHRNISSIGGLELYLRKVSITLHHNYYNRFETMDLAVICDNEVYARSPVVVDFKGLGLNNTLYTHIANGTLQLNPSIDMVAMVDRFTTQAGVPLCEEFYLVKHFLEQQNEEMLRRKLCNVAVNCGLFGNKHIVLLDKEYGFTFFGNFVTMDGKALDFKGIRKHDGLIFSSNIKEM